MIREFLPGIARVFSNVMPILIFFIFAQIINIEELGLLNYVIALVTLVGIFTDFGLPEAIQRFLPQTKNKKELITYTLKLEFVIVFLAAILFSIFDLSKGYLLPLFLIIIFSASNTIILIFNGLEEKKVVSKFFGFSALIFLLTTMAFYFIFDFNPTASLIYGRLISWILYTFVPIYTLNKKGLLERGVFCLKKHPKFNRFAINTFIYLSSLALMTQWDSILITNVDGAYTNGLYKSVAFIATIPIVLVTILHTKLLPFFSKLNSKKEFQKIRLHLFKNIKHVGMFLTIIYTIALLIYEPVLNIFLDHEIVKNAGFLFPIILLAVCIQILITPFIATLQAMGLEKIIVKISIFQTTVFLTISTLLYNPYGYSIFPYLMLLLNLIVFLTLGVFTYTKLQKYNITDI